MLQNLPAKQTFRNYGAAINKRAGQGRAFALPCPALGY